MNELTNHLEFILFVIQTIANYWWAYLTALLFGQVVIFFTHNNIKPGGKAEMITMLYFKICLILLGFSVVYYIGRWIV